MIAADSRVDAGQRERGRIAHSAGLMGEDSVSRSYLERGYTLLASRWRTRSGEIDLIMRRGDEYVFVEVKKAARHGYAAERISRRQMDRICNAALELCAEMAQGLMTLMRFDAALVDQFGRVEVIENAFGAA